MNIIASTLLTGVIATAVMDAGALARRALLGTPAPDYGLVGRWLGHMPQGRFRHAAIARAAAVRGERTLGWTAHYLIGIGYAALLPLFAGSAWFSQPTPCPAVAVGLATLAAPFLLMQPGMGAGIAARHTPHPWAARRNSLFHHTVFGLGLYAGGLVTAALQTGVLQTA